MAEKFNNAPPEPLRPPVPWPMPTSSSPSRWERALKRVPVIGWFIASFLENTRVAEQAWNIESQIVDQLRHRSTHQFWSNDPERQAIADVISEAIAMEQGIPPPSIHPDDPMEFLFVGELTPLSFSLRLRQRRGIGLSRSELFAFWQNHLTASDVIEYCIKKSHNL